MDFKNEAEMKQIFQAFADAGFLSDVILIGSWCLPFYAEVFEGFVPNVRTTDIDFYIPDSKHAEANDVSVRLKEIDYDHFQDSMTNKSRFVSPNGFEIEFLAKLNRDGLSCVRVGSSGIFAESLSYLDIYSTNFLKFNKNGLEIKVASPSAFVIQKILINNRRGHKAEKDIEAIKYVLSFLSISSKSRKEFYSIFDSLPKKMEKNYRTFLRRKGHPTSTSPVKLFKYYSDSIANVGFSYVK